MFLLLNMATAYLTLALVGSVVCVGALQQPLHIYFVHMMSLTVKYLYFSSLGGIVQ